jgi:5-methyltetrahydrofolate--homocysteine methyltransferase
MAESFRDALSSGRVLLMDGAMGTELQRLGLTSPSRPEDWNLERPDVVWAIHQAYIGAGAAVLLTNTFQANPLALAERSTDFLIQSIRSAIRIARDVAGASFVLADIGPIVVPGGVEFSEPADLGPLAKLAAEGGCDGILLETCSTMRVRHAVERLARSGLPVLLSLCFRREGDRYLSFDGCTPGEFAVRAADWGAVTLGVNCGRDIEIADCAAIVRQYREVCRLPLFARPNAGTPQRDGEGWVYPRNPEMMAAQLPLLLDAGVSMVGGCCGTTPAHIAAFRAVIGHSA